MFHTTRTLRGVTHFLFRNDCWPRARRMATVLLLLLSPLVATSRATVVDFEDPSLSLAPNSYWNGSDNSGGFTSRGVYFGNSYTDFGGGYVVWDGWSYSNVNDTTTPGFSNQYASYAGAGAGGSASYALGYIDLYDGALPSITIPGGMQVQSAMFTNTTYAGLSMLYGDQYAKQFGPTDWFCAHDYRRERRRQQNWIGQFLFGTEWFDCERLAIGRSHFVVGRQDAYVQPRVVG